MVTMLGGKSQRGARRGPRERRPREVVLESGIRLHDVLYTLSGKVDRRAYPGTHRSGHGPSTGSW
jgi:hypothetical protein